MNSYCAGNLTTAARGVNLQNIEVIDVDKNFSLKILSACGVQRPGDLAVLIFLQVPFFPSGKHTTRVREIFLMTSP